MKKKTTLDRIAESPETTRAPRPLNVSKLVLHNLCQPFEKRIDPVALDTRRRFARARGQALAVFTQIHNEVEPLREAIRRKQAFVDTL